MLRIDNAEINSRIGWLLRKSEPKSALAEQGFQAKIILAGDQPHGDKSQQL